jgi:hypothetical protein
MRVACERGGHKSVFSRSEFDSACSLSNSVLCTKLPRTIKAIGRT